MKIFPSTLIFGSWIKERATWLSTSYITTREGRESRFEDCSGDSEKVELRKLRKTMTRARSLADGCLWEHQERTRLPGSAPLNQEQLRESVCIQWCCDIRRKHFIDAVGEGEPLSLTSEQSFHLFLPLSRSHVIKMQKTESYIYKNIKDYAHKDTTSRKGKKYNFLTDY